VAQAAGMTRRKLFFAALAAFAAASLPAGAAPPAPAHGESADDANEKEIARSVELGGLVFPMFDEKRKLKNYIFVSARMLAGPNKDPWKYREQAHFIRDAVIRAAHRTSFNVKGDYNKLDEKLAAAECLKAANEILGEKDALVTMSFKSIASQGGW
jgi:hypothetical protein